MNLPEDFRVDTGRLAGCFNNTSATYKFYWLLAVLAEAEKGQEKIDKTSLFAQMVAHAWYTVNYFKISFGSADKLERAISRIRELEGLAVDASPAEVHWTLVQSQRKETQRELRHFDINVPHTTNLLSISLWIRFKARENDGDVCVMDFSHSIKPTLLAIAVVATLLVVALQAGA